ncbi:GNAT family N-acetyltransferase [Pseudalkalibacillus sp. A8]|uniref:GNAT family N-acetyltransferase n=1 Tax=Pseudalkalibacillus sp. A8 TaxID=3382641 RepID=UPI0038B56730
MSIHIRKTGQLMTLGKNDIMGLIALSKSVGWDYDENDIQTILSSGIVFGHKNQDGQIVSCAAIIPYDSYLASIGMVIVNKEYRGLGLGKEATDACIRSVPKKSHIMLIATQDGIPLYKRMGFKEVDCVHKFSCKQYLLTKYNDSTDLSVEVFNKDEFERIIELDKEAFGDGREKFLINRIEQSHESLVVRDKKGMIIGYGLSIFGSMNLILGPIVAPNQKAASLLIHHLACNHKGRLRIDVPSGQELFMEKLIERGFEEVNQPPIMIYNSDEMPLRHNTLYGIAAQIFG